MIMLANSFWLVLVKFLWIYSPIHSLLGYNHSMTSVGWHRPDKTRYHYHMFVLLTFLGAICFPECCYISSNLLQQLQAVWVVDIRWFFAWVFFKRVCKRRYSGWNNHFTMLYLLPFISLWHDRLTVHETRTITLHDNHDNIHSDSYTQ